MDGEVNMGVFGHISGKTNYNDDYTPNKKIIGNPNPYNFKVLFEYKFNNKTLLIVNYPDSITFEGNKILSSSPEDHLL